MRDVTYKAVGWSIRYIMTLQQNYLGSFTTFSTLTEYVDKFKKGAPRGDPIELKYRPGKVRLAAIVPIFIRLTRLFIV